jgi:hypothetical protein
VSVEPRLFCPEQKFMQAHEIFARDKYQQDLMVGDIVQKGRSKYLIRNITWEVSGDGYYHETVYLHCKNTRSGKKIIFEDSEAELA